MYNGNHQRWHGVTEESKMDKITKKGTHYYAYPFVIRFETTYSKFPQVEALEVFFQDEQDATVAEDMLLTALDELCASLSDEEVQSICAHGLVVRTNIENPHYRGRRPEKRAKDDICVWEHVVGF